MKKSVKLLTLALALTAVVLMALGITSCGEKKEQIVIYTSTEDYGVVLIQSMLNEQFPQYDITVQYLSTGDQAAKLLAEGEHSEADIIHNTESLYLAKLEAAGVLADVSGISSPDYASDLPVSKYFYPEVRDSGAIIVNNNVLAEKGLAKPTCYEDLLKPEYKNLISMPDPSSSGTGYMFLKSLVNLWGEDKAFTYFKSLSDNILQFTSSGSGPVKALVQGEAGIALGMTANAVTTIQDGNSELEIIFFEEGSPYSVYGQSIVKGKDERACVKEVFEYLINHASIENCKQYHPEKLLANEDFKVEGFPENMKYADMSGNTIEVKEDLLKKWEEKVKN